MKLNEAHISYDEKTSKPTAEILLWVKEGTIIQRDSVVYVFGAFALNETILEIVMRGEGSKDILKDGDVIHGIDPIPMEFITERGLVIVDRIEEIASKINDIIGEEESQEAFKLMILDMSELLQYMNKMVNDKGDDFNLIIDDIVSCTSRLNTMIDNVDNADGTMGKLMYDDELYQEVREFVREITLHPWRLMKRDKKSKRDDD